ncbi:MAG: hypothetical protein U0572_15780 [Phycisphaerales bacterium]
MAVAAAFFVIVAAAVACVDVTLRLDGRQWIDLLPTRLLASLAFRAKPDSDASVALQRNLEFGISRDDAAAALASYVAADPPSFAATSGSDPRERLVDRWLGIARPDEPLASRVLANRCCGMLRAWRDADDPALLHVATDGLDDAMGLGGIVLRPDDLRVAGVPAMSMIEPAARVAEHGWCRTGAHPALAVRTTTPSAVGDRVELRAGACWAPCPLDLWCDALDRSGATSLADAGVPTLVGSIVLSTVVEAGEPTAPRRNWWGQMSQRRYDGFLARAVPAVIGGTLAGACFALVAVFAASAARGWLALAPPRCRRCAAIQRSRTDGIGDRCAECGADLAASRAVRWTVGRPALSSLLVTVPLVALGGVALAATIGVLAAGAAPALALRLAWRPLDEMRRQAEIMCTADDLNARRLAQDRMTEAFADAINDPLTRTSERDRMRAGVEVLDRLAAMDDAVLAACGLGRGWASSVSEMVQTLYQRGYVDRATASEWMRRFVGAPWITLPAVVRASAPAYLRQWSDPQFTRGVRVATIDDRRVDGVWLLWNEEPTIELPIAPGAHLLEIDWCCVIARQIGVEATELPELIESSAGTRGRARVPVFVVEDASNGVELGAPEFDPFAQPGFTVAVTARQWGTAASFELMTGGPLGSLFSADARGQWELLVSDGWRPLCARTTGTRVGTIVPGERADRRSVTVRWVPDAPVEGNRLVRGTGTATWCRERTIVCRRIGSLTALSDPPSTEYLWTQAIDGEPPREGPAIDGVSSADAATR